LNQKDHTKEISAGRELSLRQIAIRILQGMLIGAGAVLPGISGGVLCVVFGFYQAFIDVFSNPIRGIKAHYKRLIPLCVGYLIGMLLFARLLVIFFERWEIFVLWFFIGLIVGTLPSLWNEARAHEKSKGSWLSLIIGFAVMVFWLFFMDAKGVQVAPSFFWWIICGVLLGLSIIVPGLSYSTFFIYLGLFIPYNEGVANLDFGVLLPVIIGALASIVLLSRLMKKLIAKHASIIFHAILGIVIASLLSIVPIKESVAKNALIYLICFVAGCIVPYLMDRFGNHKTGKAHNGM